MSHSLDIVAGIRVAGCGRAVRHARSRPNPGELRYRSDNLRMPWPKGRRGSGGRRRSMGSAPNPGYSATSRDSGAERWRRM